MEGTGGVRKLRWRRDGRGKGGGIRVIYYFHSEAISTARRCRCICWPSKLVQVLVKVWIKG